MHLLCRLSSLRTRSVIQKFQLLLFFFLSLFVLLPEHSRGQVMNITQASVLEGFAGRTPNLTGASAIAVQGNYAYVVGTGDVLQILDITLPGLPLPKGNLYHGSGGASILRAQSIVVRGNYAYITSYGADALEIVDVSDPYNPVHKGVLYDGKGEAPFLKGAWGLKVIGDYAYVASTNSKALEIVDISNPSSPKHKGALRDGSGVAPYLNSPVSVAVSGNYAYLGNLNDDPNAISFEVVDISNPALPAHVSAMPLGNNQYLGQVTPYGITVSGNYAYVAEWNNGGFQIIDISNPAAPVHKGLLLDGEGNQTLPPGSGQPPYLYGAWTVRIVGQYAYVGCAYYILDPTGLSGTESVGVLEVINISNPEAPVHAGAGAFSTRNEYSRGLEIVGDKAYMPARVEGTLSIVSLADPVAPKVIATAESGSGGALLNSPSYVIVDGTYAYIGNAGQNAQNGNAALEVVDVSDPTKPVHAGGLDRLEQPYIFPATSLFKKSDYLFVTADEVLSIIDVGVPTSPTPRGRIGSSATAGQADVPISSAKSVVVDPRMSMAYVASGRPLNRFVNPGKPATQRVSIRKVQAFTVSFYGTGSITFSGTYSGVLTGTGPNDQVSTTFTPSSPGSVVCTISGTVTNASFTPTSGIDLLSNSLSAIDFGDAVNPYLVEAVLDGGGNNAPYLKGACSMVQSGTSLYIASTESNALEIMNVFSPFDPVHQGALLHDQGGAKLDAPVSVDVQGQYAYVVSSGSRSLEIVDVSDPANPAHAGSFVDEVLLEGVNRVKVSGNYAFITASYFVLGLPRENSGKLVVVDISDPTSPVLVQVFNDGDGGALLDNPTSIFIKSPYAYMTNAGLSQNLNVVFLFGPSLQQLVPASAPVGGSVTIEGDNFNTFLAASVNGIPATITSVSATALTFTVPPGATIGKVGLTLNGQTVLSSNNLVVAPTASSATDIQQTGFTAYWSDVGSEGYYFDLSRDNFSSFVTSYQNRSLGDVTTLQVVGLQPGVSYQYRVRSTDGESVSVNSNSIVVQTIPDTPVLNPTGGVTQNSFTMSWGSVAGATGYRLDVATDEAFTQFLTGLENLLVSSTTQTINVGSSGTSYYYRVRSVNASGISPSSSTGVALTIPSSPVVNAPDQIDSNGFTAEWEPSVGASEYHIDVSLDNFTTFVTGYRDQPTQNSTLLGVTGLAAGTNYQFRVSALNSSGESGNSATVILVTKPVAPVVSLVSGTGNQSSFGVSWPPVTGATSYKVDVATDNGFLALVYNNVDVGNVTSYTAASLAANTSYFLRVRASNASGTSNESNTVSAKTLSSLPTSPSSGVSFSGLDETSLTLNFVPGNGASHLVLVNASGTLSELPVNGTSYTGNTVFGTGASVGTSFVASSGVGPITITGLSPATTYYFYVYDFNGSAGSENYLTTTNASNPVAVSTLAAAPTAQATSITFSNASATSVTVSLTAASTAPTGYLVLRTINSLSSDVPANGTSYSIGATLTNSTVAYVGTSLSFFDGGLLTSKTYRYTVYAFNGLDKSVSYLKTSPLEGEITLDTESPVIAGLNSNPSTIAGGNTPIFTAVITDNVSVASAKIFYRGVSQKSFISAPLTATGAGGNYTVQIQTNWYDSLGIEYYFWAVDQNGNESAKPSSNNVAQLVTSFNIPSLPSGDKQTDYGIVAFPYQLTTGNKVTNVYPGVPWNDNSKAGMWWWDPSLNGGAGAYTQYGTTNAFETVDPGKGYWMIVRTTASPQLSNVVAPKYNQNNLFSMTLKPKWNQIGNPYPVPISWDDVIAYNQSKNPSALFSELNVYGETGYKSASDGVLLKAFEGGFVNNLGSGDITIQIPFPGQATTGRTLTDRHDISDDQWSVSLNIQQDGAENQLGGFGMHPHAKTGVDWFDNYNPPRFMDAPEVNFTNREYPNIRFSREMVNRQPDYVWQFTPAGTEGKSMRLTWDDNLQSTSSQELFLFDEERLTVVDMLQESQYEFMLTSQSRFRIFYGRDVRNKITPTKVVAGLPYPNPLLEQISSKINIALPDNSSDYSVRIQLFNSTGNLMETIQKTLRPGIHAVDVATKGNELMPGIYIYRLTVKAANSSNVYNGKIVKP